MLGARLQGRTLSPPKGRAVAVVPGRAGIPVMPVIPLATGGVRTRDSLQFGNLSLTRKQKFIDAARRGDLQAVIQMKNAGVDINAQDFQKHTALTHAVLNNHLYVTRYLLQVGAVLQEPQTIDKSLIGLAIHYQNDEMVRTLVAHAPDYANVRDLQGKTVLQAAVETGSPKLVKALLENGANPNSVSAFMTYNGSVGIYKSSPVLAAIGRQDAAMLKLLIQHGAKLNNEAFLDIKTAETPLAVAVRQNFVEGIEILLEHGALPDVENRIQENGRYETPWDVAQKLGRDDILSAFEVVRHRAENPAGEGATSPEDTLSGNILPEERLLRHFLSGQSLLTMPNIGTLIRDPDIVNVFAYQLRIELEDTTGQGREQLAKALCHHYFNAKGFPEVARFFNRISDQLFEKPVLELAKQFDEMQPYLSLLTERVEAPRDRVVSPQARGFDGVIGMEEIKEQLLEEVIQPWREPDEEFGRPNGLLLYGPTGTGKTYIANRLAEEIGYPMIEVKCSDLISGTYGESLERIKAKFDEARKAAPCVLFMDEFDSLAINRQGISENHNFMRQEINEILTQLNDMSQSGVLVVAATNQKDALDPAMIRPGRFDVHLEILAADVATRRRFFEVFLGNKMFVPGFDQAAEFDRLAGEAEGFTPPELIAVCRHVSRLAKKRQTAITQAIMDEAMQRVRRQKGIPAIASEAETDETS